MDIKISKKFRILSDRYNFILVESVTPRKGKNKGKKIEIERFYFSALEHLFEYILQKRLRESTTTSMKEFLKELREIKKELQEIFDTKIGK